MWSVVGSLAHILLACSLFKKSWKNDKGFELNDKWISLYHPEHGDEIQGEVKVTVELLTKEMADARPNMPIPLIANA